MLNELSALYSETKSSSFDFKIVLFVYVYRSMVVPEKLPDRVKIRMVLEQFLKGAEQHQLM